MRRRITYRYLRLMFYNRGGLNARLRETSFSRHYGNTNRTPLVALTSNTTPAPYITSATNDNANAWKAFDRAGGGNYWSINNTGANYITIDLGPDKKRWRVPEYVYRHFDSVGREPDEIFLYGSHDNKMFTLLGGRANNTIFAVSHRYWFMYEKSQPSILQSMMYVKNITAKKPNFFPFMMQMGDL